ncbi:hypothetical protein [Glaciimonas sp. PAMC28666]|uniref:hypothetical protein n=1 Tax=Glaciimonas sp. PAMC28666 TaxID=2807626 RepID=UPI00196497E4|nr:hypothetical protein [Glaciimonas sp. PAMC28666]QRX82071.1 hypothetical protein JQN73_18460 [Glaciimonas sp. PAMC28666]
MLTPHEQIREFGRTIANQQQWIFPADLALSQEAIEAGNTHPREAGEQDMAYAKRLQQHYPSLRISNLFALSNVHRSTLQARPEFKTMSAAAKDAQISHPREPTENNITFALRLRRQLPTLTVSDISVLSETHESILRVRSEFKTLSAQASKVQAGHPRQVGERNMAYALRLRREVPTLTVSDYCALSEVSEAFLRNRSEFQTLTAAANVAKINHPRKKGEQNVDYALRLKKAVPSLNVSDCSRLSGTNVSTLRARSAFKTWPQEAIEAGISHPRVPDESNETYALRLRREIPTLSAKSCGLLSGMLEMILRARPEFKTLSAAAEEVKANYPRHDGEKSMDYALRLKANDLHLSIADYCGITTVNESTLRNRPGFKTLSAAAVAAKNANPRMTDESSMAYAVRLKATVPTLTIRDYSGVSGVSETSLWALPMFKVLSEAGKAAEISHPRIEGEDNKSYALRLKKEIPNLRIADYSILAHLHDSSLRNWSEFKMLSAEARAAGDRNPRSDGEENMAYAIRLKAGNPFLNLRDCAILSDVNESSLRNRSMFKKLSPAAINAQISHPRCHDEDNMPYARRLKREVPGLSISDYCRLSDVNEASLRNRFKNDVSALRRAEKETDLPGSSALSGPLDLDDLYFSPEESPASSPLDFDDLYFSSEGSPAASLLDLEGLSASLQGSPTRSLAQDDFEEYNGTPQASPTPSLPSFYDLYCSSPAASGGRWSREDFEALGDYGDFAMGSPAPSSLGLEGLQFTPPGSPLLSGPMDAVERTEVQSIPGVAYWIVYENNEGDIQSVRSPEGDVYPFDVLENSDNFYVVRNEAIWHVVNHVGGLPVSFSGVNEMLQIIHELEFRRGAEANLKRGRWRSRESYGSGGVDAKRGRFDDGGGFSGASGAGL